MRNTTGGHRRAVVGHLTGNLTAGCKALAPQQNRPHTPHADPGTGLQQAFMVCNLEVDPRARTLDREWFLTPLTRGEEGSMGRGGHRSDRQRQAV